jgi:glycosyltransferase involved in cell wall biosynthesis
MNPTPAPAAAPPVSVVIPVYNRAATIAAAIESVLRQTWRDFELIVVDDGSTDGTLAAAAEVRDPRVRLVANPRNLGAAAARNAGVAEARGTWIAFQDSDDEWLPLKLEKQMARLDAPGAGFVAAYCGLLTLGGLDNRPGERLQLRYVPGPAIAPAEGDLTVPLLRANMISTQTLVVRRDRFFTLGQFDPDTTPIEDWDFVLRLAREGPIAFVDEPLVHQRFSANSITRQTAKRLASRIRVVEKNRTLFATRPAMLARQYRIVAQGLAAQGDLAGARRYIALARRAAPGDPRIWARSLEFLLRSALPCPAGADAAGG